MPKYHATECDAETVQDFLAARDGLGHLRIRRYSDSLTLESGPKEDPILHARFRRDTVHLWKLEMATHTGRWQRTPFRDLLDNLLKLVATDFGFTLAPRE